MTEIFGIILIEGLIYGIMALGVFISFRILDFPDLTVDGSFPMGAAVMAACLLADIPYVAAFALTFIAGSLAGMTTAVFHNKLKIPGLLAGILTMTILYSINLRIQNFSPNISFLKVETLFDSVHDMMKGVMGSTWSVLLLLVAVTFVLKTLLDLFFHTDMGLTLGAMGDNEQMVIAQGVNPRVMKMIGIGVSNGLVAISGAFAAQYQGQADVNLGRGIVVMGLASVMIGEFLIKSNRISLLTLRVLLGSIAFRGIMFLARNLTFLNLKPSDLQLIYGLSIVLLLLVTGRKQKKNKRSV
ncbi:ABC transporter permease [Spirochaeta isovalerica]|uniref:Putative ABC transport system permease protein n=1 Tax=Spirochaeta isovalerica TaxID=150 RepID=A0A841RBM8_9SPIO|nr:ABC transporter permease [Spirochaeta isovalerica]MBB6481375.1 putative ABC transport system permease protein [Spirochaeta isovalerica]